MVNVKEYVPKETSDYVNVELIKGLNEKKGVIMPGSEFVEFMKEDGTKIKKPQITVSIAKTNYKWTLSPTASSMLMEDLGPDTDAWVGAVIKFIIQTAGSTPYVTATVIALPEVKEKKEDVGGSSSLSSNNEGVVE